jgi:hypothetical protein
MGSPSRDEHKGKIFDPDCPLHTSLDILSDTRSVPLSIPPAPSTDISLENAPDGGVLAWFQVVGCFFVLMNTWCVNNYRYDPVLTAFTSGASSTHSEHTRGSMKSISSVRIHRPRFPGLVPYRATSCSSSVLSPAHSLMQGTTVPSLLSGLSSFFSAS